MMVRSLFGTVRPMFLFRLSVYYHAAMEPQAELSWCMCMYIEDLWRVEGVCV